MKLYQDTEKELTLCDYKPLTNINLMNESILSLEQLEQNLSDVSENAWFSGNDLLAMAVDNDISKIRLYVRMKQKKLEKEKQASAKG